MRMKTFLDGVERARGKEAADRLRADVRAIIKGARHATSE